jgi:hypothetical protein
MGLQSRNCNDNHYLSLTRAAVSSLLVMTVDGETCGGELSILLVVARHSVVLY